MDLDETLLPRVQADAAVHFRDSRVRLVPGVWQDRPFSRLLRLGVYRDGSDRPAAHLFLKVTKPTVLNGDVARIRDRVARDFAITRRVHDSMLPYGDVGAVPAVACYPEHLAIVTEEVEGPTLLAHLERHASWFPSGDELSRLERRMATVGRWLQVFQAMDRPDGRVAVDELVRYVDHRLQRLVRHAPARFGESDRAEVLRHLDWLGARIAPDDLAAVPTHSDLSLGNVLVSGDRIVVLDFAMAKTGSRLHDLARLFVQLELLALKPRIRAAVIGRLQRSLLEGFDASVTPGDPLFRFLVLLHRVNSFTKLSINHASPATALYNRLVRWHQQRRLAGEIGQRAVAEGA